MTPPREILDRLSWRCIGPYRAGRVVAVAGHPGERNTFFFGSTGGGVWRSDDAGIYWTNVSDGYFRRASVGAIAISPSHPDVIYAGMGECCIRGNVSHGDGVYRSSDGGRTWTHLGLEATRHIGKVRIDPSDPDTVYVAALGHAHGPNEERGVYRSRDGGRTWSHVLQRGPRAGAVDLSIDPTDPRILYATLWEAVRRPWEIVSGGAGSGIFRSTDAGDSWTELTRAPGLPRGVLGKIGISASPRDGRVYAIVEATDGGVFRSDDGGETWERGSEATALRERAWYYQHVYAHPTEADSVWVLNKNVWISRDRGVSFDALPMPHKDHHDVWIDPSDPQRIIEGNDAGAIVSLNGGKSWSSMFNQPTAEMYHVAVDDGFPYRVYGNQQDNTTISVPSRTATGAITTAHSYDVGGGESGYVSVKPGDPSVVYATNHFGTVTRHDRRTAQSQNVAPWPVASRGASAKIQKHRFNWVAPVVVSRHDPKTVYFGGERLFRSTDEGRSWRAISPDLTRNDRSKQGDSGGPITVDNSGVDIYCTISCLAEGPSDPDVLWVGSDDGLIHVSRDGAKTWMDVTPKGIEPFAFVTSISPSPHKAGTAYATLTRYKLDDFRPYVLRTSDHGKRWTSIAGGLPADEPARVIREDPERLGLLYVGTEAGLHVSFDSGKAWHRFGGSLPPAPIHDVVVAGSDLVAATHGRSFWVLDDLSVLRQVSGADADQPVLFTPREMVRMRVDADTSHLHRHAHGRGTGRHGERRYSQEGPVIVAYDGPRPSDAGTNAPAGALIWYWLPREPKKHVRLTFLDARGRTIRTYASEIGGTSEGSPQARAGLNRFVWDMRYPDAHGLKGAADVAVTGPRARPGAYRVRLDVDGERMEQPLVIRKDPRVAASDEDLAAQFDLHTEVRDKLSDVHAAIEDIRAHRERTGSADARLAAIEGKLTQLKAKSHGDMAMFPSRLNDQLGNLMAVIDSADAAPTASMREAFAYLARSTDRLTGEVREIVGPEKRPSRTRSRGGAPTRAAAATTD